MESLIMQKMIQKLNPHAMIFCVSAALLIPLFMGGYMEHVGFQILYFGLLGTSWNIMGGYCGLLSMGHTVFSGTAAYTIATALALNISLIIGVPLAILCTLCVALCLVFLSHRFQIFGVYFMLLSIALNEIFRITADGFTIFGGASGLFIPDILPQWGIYICLLGCGIGAIYFLKWLLTSPLGYFANATKNDPTAAESIGIQTLYVRLKMAGISAIIASISGMLWIFYNGSTFPDTAFSLSTSLDILMVCLLGGMGTLYGPWIGAVLYIVLSEFSIMATDAFDIQSGPIKPIITAILLIFVITKMPSGIVPFLQRKIAEK